VSVASYRFTISVRAGNQTVSHGPDPPRKTWQPVAIAEWNGYAVYAQGVRLGTVERTWRDPEGAMVMVRSLFPGSGPLLLSVDEGAQVREVDRRIEVGRSPAVLLPTDAQVWRALADDDFLEPDDEPRPA
jgi:hypothetical protein